MKRSPINLGWACATMAALAMFVSPVRASLISEDAMGRDISDTRGAGAVFPTLPHAANNFIPFGFGSSNQPAVMDQTMHQVFASSLFSSATGGLPAQITSIGFAPGVVGTYNADVTFRLGYTNRTPGVGSGSGGLSIPVAGGGGSPNASGAMSAFFSNPAYSVNITTMGPTSFSELLFPGSFIYDPTLGNLLVEVVTSATFAGNVNLTVSRANGSAESSRAFATNLSLTSPNAESPTTAIRMDFAFTAVPEPGSLALLGLGGVGLVARRKRRS